MQALNFFFRNQKIFSAIRRFRSFRRGYFHAFAHTNVLLCHTDRGMSQLIAGFAYVAFRFFLTPA
jgi:hypothetical protein